MIFTELSIPGVFLIEPTVFGDTRGYFMEAYKKQEFEQFIGKYDFIQDNESCSSKGVLRGLHYQLEPYAQSKLVRVMLGVVLDIVVDLRKGSPTFGQYIAMELSGDNKRQLFIPKGLAHGFYVKSEMTVFSYKVDNPYSPTHECGIRYDDPVIDINWQIKSGLSAIVSEKDRKLPLLKNAEINFQYKKLSEK